MPCPERPRRGDSERRDSFSCARVADLIRQIRLSIDLLVDLDVIVAVCLFENAVNLRGLNPAGSSYDMRPALCLQTRSNFRGGHHINMATVDVIMKGICIHDFHLGDGEVPLGR